MAKRFNTPSLFLHSDVQSPWFRYGMAVLAVACAALASECIPVIGQRAAFMFYFFAIIQAAYWLGLYPGLTTLALSLAMVNLSVLFPGWIAEPYNVAILNLGFIVVSVAIIHTASHHRRLAVELWSSRQDLNRAQAVAQTGSWRMDVRRNLLHWSDENHRIFGIPKGMPLTYDTFLATVHPEDREYVDQKWQTALAGEPYDIEHRAIVAGEVIWVHEKAELEFNKHGQLLGGFGTTQDITALRRNELMLLENQLRLVEIQQQYTGIVKSAMDAIITIDSDQRIVVFNAAAEKMFGCTADEAIGESLNRFIPRRFRHNHGTHVRAFGHAGISSRKMGFLGEISGLHSNGEEFPIEVSISQAVVNGKKTFTAILRDITERVRAETALIGQLRLQDQLAKVAATVPGVICSFRMRPDGSSHMPYASPAFESVSGISREVVAVDFSPFFACIHPGDLGHVDVTTTESARTLQPWFGEFRYRHPTKGEIWLESHSMPEREPDGSVLWHGYIQDITERKLAEMALRDRENELQLIMDATPALISYLDTNFRYLRINKAYENWFCMDPGHILGHTAQDIIGERAWHIVSPYLERARSGERVGFDYQIPYGTGKPRWVQGYYIPDKDANGVVKGVVVHVIDIEDRKQAELERQKFVSLADSSQEFIGMCDMNLKPFYANAAALRLVGLDSLEQAFQTPVQEFFFPEDQRFITEEFFPRVLREKSGEVEIRFRHFQTGEAIWMVYNVFFIEDGKGEAVGLATVSRDITARKRADAALRESERHNRFLANILESSDQAFGIGWADGRVDYVNAAFEKLTGFSRDELLAMDWAADLTPPEWREVEQAKLQALQHTRAVRYEKEYFRKDGNRVPIELMVELEASDAGQPARYFAFITDLTERKQAAAKLRENEAQMLLATQKHLHEIQVHKMELETQNEELQRASIALEASRGHYVELYDFAPVGYLSLTTEGIITEVNLAAAQLLGVARKDLIQRRFVQFIPDGYKDRWHLFSLWAKQRGGKQNAELPLRREDGTELFIRFDCECQKMDGECLLMRIALTDITERTLANAALRMSEARLALVVEEVKAGYMDWDLNSKQIYFSPEWKAQLGYEDHELRNQWTEKQVRLHPDDRASVEEATENCIAGRQPSYELEFRLRHKDGSYRWIHARSVVLCDANNQPYRLLGLNLDITDYKQRNELMARRNKMEQSFQLYVASQTAAAIAHELNQPLTAISYYADVAQELLQAGNQNPQKLSGIMEKCSQQALRAGGVIRQLMAILHKGEATSEPVDINASIREVLNFIKADEQLGAFKINLDLAANLPLVTANNLQIQKVLINLLHNGLDAMRESGSKTGTISVTTKSTPSAPFMAQVSVCDSGKGVADPSMLKSMFQPFHTTKPNGLGMGLAISRALIEAHNGNMWAEQNVGPGITIHFSLPF